MSTKHQTIDYAKLQDPKKPSDWSAFMVDACRTFEQKSTDYDDRFVKALMTMDAQTLWAWEVDKKLDRIRTWMKRGNLAVKGEGIRNSVDDLFIYTVQYAVWMDVQESEIKRKNFLDRIRQNRATWLYSYGKERKPADWVKYLVNRDRIHPDERNLQLIIRQYLGDVVRKDEWQAAIEATLKGS